MRRLLAVLISAVLFLPGCGGDEKQDNSADQRKPAATHQPKELAQEQPGAEQIETSVESPVLDPLPAEVAQMKIFQPWKGDLDGMIKRRTIRTLVVYNKTTYFVDKGQPLGIACDAMKAFETVLNKKLNLGKVGIHVVFIPVSRAQLLPALAERKGDLAIAGLTVTPERQKLVDFTPPVYKDSSEIVVTGPGAPQITTVQDLAGQEIFVRKGGSKYESLLKLNGQFKNEGKKQIIFRFAPENFEDEDILEMTNAGLVKIAVIDKLVAEFWKQIFPDITLHPDVAVRTGADIAWAVRKNTPQLTAELNEFIKTHGKGTSFGNVLLQKYLKNIKFVKNAGSEAELKKYAHLRQIFQEYGKKYDLDWILMAAQGYQESRLDQNVKSQVGAIGVMQVMPATGEELKVGDIREIEPNIHAGVKYMHFMINQYYKNEPMDKLNKALFTFASYNCGPGRVRGLRKEAEKRGLNPNIWFNNVEYIAAEKIGHETITYVSNIYKYYIAYKLINDQEVAREKAKQEMKQ